MKYFFESKLEKNDNGFFISIPFNVWEVCRQRDVIQADVVLDNRIIPCELLPKEKGKYVIELEAEEVSGIEVGVPLQILLHVTGSLIRMDQDSPYDLEHPVRKIDGMEVIKQPEDGLCGQACVAMLAGRTIEEVMTIMDCREWQATMGRMISALNYYGIDHADVIHYVEGRNVVLPKCCIMMERMGRYCHYLIHYDGLFYDSNLGVLQEYDMSKLLGFLEIKC